MVDAKDVKVLKKAKLETTVDPNADGDVSEIIEDE